VSSSTATSSLSAVVVTDVETGGRPQLGAGAPATREVSSIIAYQRLSPFLGRPTVTIGTPEWWQLEETGRDFWQAVLWAALRWAIDQDIRQEHLADASHEIAAAADWSALAQRVRNGRGDHYIERKRTA